MVKPNDSDEKNKQCFFVVVRRDLPDCGHMMAGMGAGLFVAGRVADDGDMARLRSHHFAYSAAAIADYDNGWRFT